MEKRQPDPIPFLAGLAFPGSCVVCDGPLPLRAARREPSGTWRRPRPGAPLCARCAAALAPEPGPRCLRCGLPLLSEAGTCMRCREADFAFDSAWPLWRYAGAAARVIAAYKFGARRSLAPFLARLLATGAARFPGAVVVGAPCSPRSLRKRGWDQSALLARELGRLGFPVAALLVRRPGAEQKTLDHDGRLANLADAIRVRGRAPGRVLLVDDVMTTGATLSACARALKAAGALRVDALTRAAD